MSYHILAKRRLPSTGVRAAPVTSYDNLVLGFEPNVISYWKFANNGTDQQGVQNATITGSPELSVPTIVDLDTVSEGAPADGICVAWPGTIGEYGQAANNSAHKTSEGTIAVTHQHDALNEKSVLVCADATGAAGGLSIEVETNGSPRAFLRNASAVPIVLLGSPGLIELNRAYTSILKWGSAGLALAVYDDAGALVVRLTNATTDGVTGTSVIRFGAWHTDVAHHDGPFGRVIWMDRRITDAEEAILARAKTITHTGGGGGGTSVSIGTLQAFSRSSINVTALAGWPVGRLPDRIVTQGARCSAYVRRSWKPTNNSGTHIDFVTGWQKTTTTETIRLRLDNGAEIDLTYQVGHTIPSPGSGGITRTLDRSATPSGTTYNTWAAAIAALTSNDVLIVRAPTGTWTDSGGHAIPNFVYDVTSNIAPGAIGGVTVIAHPDDVAAGRRPVIWRNAGRYARFKYAASAAWQVNQDLGSGRVIYESAATSAEPAHSYFAAYRDQVGDWIGLYGYQAINDGTDRSSIMHDTSYPRFSGTNNNTFVGPSCMYNKITDRWEVRLDGPVKQTYMNPASSAPFPPWDWSKHQPASLDARQCEIVITDGNAQSSRNYMLDLAGRNGWKFYNIDFVYGNSAVNAESLSTQPEFYGCTFLGGAHTEFDHDGTEIGTNCVAIYNQNAGSHNNDMIFDRCTIHGCMPPWTSWQEGKGFDGAHGHIVRRQHSTWSNRRQLFRYSKMVNWWHFYWMGDFSTPKNPIKWHVHHSLLRSFGHDSGLVEQIGGAYLVNRCFLPQSQLYGHTTSAGAGILRHHSFNVEVRLAAGLVGHGAVGATASNKWSDAGSTTSVPCYGLGFSVAHNSGARSQHSDRKFHNTCIGSQNGVTAEAWDSSEHAGSCVGPDTRGTANRVFNCIGAVYPAPFAWPIGRSALVALYSRENGDNSYDYNVLFKSSGMLSPGGGSNTFVKVNSGSGSGTAYADIAALRSGEGFENNGTQANPQFVVTPAWAATNPHAVGGAWHMASYMLGPSSPALTGARNLNDQSMPDYDFEALTTLAAGTNLPFRGALDPRIPYIEQEVGIVGPLPPELV